MSKHRFAASFFDGTGQIFFLFLQYSVADLHVHDLFGGEIFSNSP